MELKGESLIAAERSAVWAALNDPAVLARCIDGVETLTAAADADGATRLDGRMNARVGPVRATFAGSVRLTEVDAPNRYVLVGEGKGGVAGFAKGQAEVTLDPAGDGAETLLRYSVVSSVGGKLAQLGARLIEGTARGYAETFFARFKAEVEGPAVLPAASPADEVAVAPLAEPTPVATTAEPTPAAATAGPVAPTVPGDDAQKLHGSRPRTGLSPLVWCSVVVLIVLAVLVWQLR